MKITALQYAKLLSEITLEHDQQQIPRQMYLAIDRFIELLRKNKDTSKLNKILKRYQKISNENDSILAIKVEFAKEPTNETLKIVEETLKKTMNVREVEMKTSVVPSLIGGVRVTMDETIIDTSISKKIRTLHQTLLS